MLTQQTKQAIEDLFFSGCSISGIEMSEEELHYYYQLADKYE